MLQTREFDTILQRPIKMYLSHLSLFRELTKRLRLEGWTNQGIIDPGKYCEAIVLSLTNVIVLRTIVELTVHGQASLKLSFLSHKVIRIPN